MTRQRRQWYNKNMKYKLIVSDFDGTLLRSDNTVSERSRKVIDEYFKRGGIFTLSSGRNIASMRRRLAEAGLHTRNIPLIGLQGSVIEDNLSQRVLSETTLGWQRAAWFARECAERGIYHHVYTRGAIYSAMPNEYTELYIRLAGVGMKFVGDVAEYIEAHKEEGYIKLLAVAPDGKNVSYSREFSEMGQDGIDIFTSGKYFFECISAQAGKGNGLRKTAQLLGVDVSQTIAFGDEMNDLSMIQAAGLGVAMANGRQQLKDSAKLIAKSDDEDGVAEIIEKYCLS